MKKNAILLLFVLLSVAAVLPAQKNLLYTGAQAFTLNTEEVSGFGPAIGFESVLSNNTTIGVKAAALFSDKPFTRSIAGNWRLLENMFLIQPGFKFYSKEPFQGFHFGAHGAFMTYGSKLLEKNSGTRLSADVNELSNSSIGFGIDLGFSTMVNNRIVFGIEAYGDLLFGVTVNDEGALPLGLNARIGYKF